jgi:hypothetical protein
MEKKKDLKKSKRRGKNGFSTNRTPSLVVDRFGPGFPDRYEVRLRYAEKVTVSGTGSGSAYQFNLNGLFDPNRTGTGHQPRYFDQYTAIYSTYVVTKCKWRVVLANENANYVRYAILVSDFTTTVDVNDMIESAYSQWGMLSINTGGPTIADHKGSMILSKLHGQKYIEADPEDYTAVGSNPTDVAVITIDAEAANGSATYLVDVCVQLDYNVIFFGRKDPGPSLSNKPLVAVDPSNNNTAKPVPAVDYEAKYKKLLSEVELVTKK